MAKQPSKGKRATTKLGVAHKSEVAHRPAPLGPLILAGVATVLFFLSARLTAREPWSYDEFFHLGLAREMLSDLRLESFPWAPFSILSEHFADKEPLFHLLLMPFARLPLESAGLLGVLFGQLFVVACFAFTARRLVGRRAPPYVLALIGLGSMFALRMNMCRPHLLLLGFSALAWGLLLGERTESAAERSFEKPGKRAWIFAGVAALFGLAHAGGWIVIVYAAAWGFAGLFSSSNTANPQSGDRQILWWPIVWAGGGWLLGQLVHPNLPNNFRLLWLQNFVAPFQASPAGDAALASQLGVELTRPEASLLFEQWPALALALYLAYELVRRRTLRTRSTLALGLVALVFVAVGTFALRRFFELGAPLVVLALAALARERSRQGEPRALGSWGGVLVALALLVSGLWTAATVRSHGFGTSQPIAMAKFLAERGEPGARVFTAQWGDSAPLFYFAPQLRSLVMLDPTFFYAKDPELFREYVRLVRGEHLTPVDALLERFGARYVTIWNAPAYVAFGRQLDQDPRVEFLYTDPARSYLVLELHKESLAERPVVSPEP